MSWWEENNYSSCECGCDKAKQGMYGHSRWCSKYIAPPPVDTECRCGGPPGRQHWHSPDCSKRVWPQPEVSDLQRIQDKLKKAVENL